MEAILQMFFQIQNESLVKNVIKDFKCRRKWKPQFRFEMGTEIVYLCRLCLISLLVPVPHTFKINLIIISYFVFYIYTCFTA